MRDSLSLFDKIVSFTNGEVTYKNTLVHLNILDEDYYFSLLDMMQQQKLSEVLLTFDEINRKGFEGDIFLNGFAEFLRNLLVSKDAKVAGLLEVAEDFKSKYTQAAAKIPASWIISAINIVNDAESNLRQAKNKRLHTELALIKLSYLNQALEFSEDGGLKKKLSDKVKSVSFRSLVPRAVPPLKEEPLPPRAKSDAAADKSSGAKLTIEDSATGTVKKTSPKRAEGGALKKGRVKSLAALQRTVEEEYLQSREVPLNDEQLRLAWQKFIERLEQEGQVSAVSSFKDAKATIAENNCIEITCSSDFHQHFVEAERSSLIHHLQTWFNNRMLTYSVKVVQREQEEQREEYLNSREKYLKIIQDYPAVQALKERLGLKLEL